MNEVKIFLTREQISNTIEVLEVLKRHFGAVEDYDLESLLNETQAAQVLGFTVRALQSWRCKGGGPSFVKISSRAVRYRRKDLLEWAEKRLHT